MNIILNFIPLKSGGGTQVGLDFLSQINKFGSKHNWYVVTTKNTVFTEYRYSDNLHLAKVIPDNILYRILFENLFCKLLINKLNASVVYTQFGPMWPGSQAINISGCAYSNLMYPELNFWEKLPYLARIKSKIIDRLRLHRMLLSDITIFETKDIEKRAITLFSLDPSRVFHVSPSTSSTFIDQHVSTESICRIKQIPNGFRVLLLSNYRVQKNIDSLPHIAHQLIHNYHIKNVIFIITLKNNDKRLHHILQLAESLHVSHCIYNIGPFPYRECTPLYNACDAVILPSLLESFSNTIIEAWHMQKPLLISDLEWARSICENGAVYFTYEDYDHCALQISKLITNNELYYNTVQNANLIIKKYSTPKTRFLSYLKIIENSTP